MYVGVYPCMYACMHVRTRVCVCACVCMHARMHACVHACVYVYMHACTHAHIHRPSSPEYRRKVPYSRRSKCTLKPSQVSSSPHAPNAAADPAIGR